MSGPIASQQIQDAKQIQILLEEALKVSAPVEIEMDTQPPEHHLLSLNSPRDLGKPNELVIVPKSTQDFKKWITNLAHFSSRISIRLAGSLIRFEVRFLSVQGNGALIEWPSQIQKIQRRQNIRVEIPASSQLKVGVQTRADSTRTLYPIFDLSAGGVAFTIPATEKLLFQPGDRLHQIRFEIEGQAIAVAATVRGVYPANTPPHFKVALEFVGLTQAQENLVSKYVFELQRKQFAKFI